jgi:hypothetical protein
MIRHWHANLGQLGSIALVFMCLIVVAGGCKPHGQEVFLELNSYYWEKQEVYSFDVTDLANSGKQEKDIIIIDLTVTNASSQSVRLKTCYMIDEEGQRFEPIIAESIPIEEDFLFQSIRADDTERGKIAFEAPENHLPLWLCCEKYNKKVKVQ